MIKIKSVSKSFDDLKVLENISLEIADGTVYGLIGLNGAGKTTLLNIISGLYRADSGEVTVSCGEDEQPVFDNPYFKQRCFYLTDDPYFIRHSTLNGMKEFYKCVYPNWSDKAFDRLVSLFGLKPFTRISDLSKGMRKKAFLILALSSKAEYILLDEIFDGIDPAARITVRDLLNEYVMETGFTVMISSHDLYEIERICDTVGVLSGRRLLYSDEIFALKNSVFRYSIGFSTAPAENYTLGINCKNISVIGNVLSFDSNESRDKIEKTLSAHAEILLFEASPLTLSEIFKYETEENKNEVCNIFS